MNESTGTSTPPVVRTAWAERPTATMRTGAQHAVTRLFDVLAPQRPPAKREEAAPVAQRHRSPTGCILQTADRAVSVSWFADSPNDTTLGELQLITWRGQVSLPGSAKRAAGGAVAVRQDALVPVDGGAAGWLWRDAAGTTYDAEALAARCHALLTDDDGAAAAA